MLSNVDHERQTSIFASKSFGLLVLTNQLSIKAKKENSVIATEESK
jgi:hypothetical protein